MLQTLLKTFPLSLVAAVSPVLIIFEIVVLSGKSKSILKTWFYVFGAGIVLLVIGVLELLVFRNLSLRPATPDNFSAYLDFIFAILLVWLLFRRPHKSTNKPKRKLPNSYYAYFALGAGLMMVNVSSLIPYLAMIKLLGETSITTIEKIQVLLLNIALILLPLIIPLLYCSIFSKSANKFLGALSSFTKRYSNIITKILLVVIIIYLIWHGISQLQ